MRLIGTHVWSQIAGTVAAGALLVCVVLHANREANRAQDLSEATRMELVSLHRVADSVSHLILVGDLVLSGESTYLVPVAVGQADALHEQVREIDELGGGAGAFLSRLDSDIEDLGELIVAGGSLDMEGRGEILNELYVRFDGAAEDAVQRLESHVSLLEPRVQEARLAASRMKAQVYSVTLLGSGMFLAAVVGLWWYLTVVISRPISRLAGAVKEASTTERFVLEPEGATEIRALAESFDRLFGGLQDALAGRAAFLANTSHELRTPLNAIIGYAELLSDEFVSKEDQEEGVASIAAAGQHLLSLIEDVLDLSKIDAGHMTVEAIPASPAAILLEVHRMLRGAAETKGIELTLDVADDVPSSVLTDPVRLRQILVNVTGNALKFTEQGAVRLSSSWEEGELCFDIVDTGIGFAPERAEAIFEDFKQADASSTRLYGGTGLGLAISRRLARLMGGDLLATSVPGEGSHFSLRIAGPIHLDEPRSLTSLGKERVSQEASHVPDSPEPPAPASATTRALRILLVDDVAINRRVGERLLARLGMKVSVAEDGQKALDLCSAVDMPFDVVLMDLQMPVMSGYEAAKVLRSRGYSGGILALSAAVMPEQQRAAVEAGCDGFVAKPFQSRELKEAINATLQGRLQKG